MKKEDPKQLALSAIDKAINDMLKKSEHYNDKIKNIDANKGSIPDTKTLTEWTELQETYKLAAEHLKSAKWPLLE